jgi:hypothetical protein
MKPIEFDVSVQEGSIKVTLVSTKEEETTEPIGFLLTKKDDSTWSLSSLGKETRVSFSLVVPKRTGSSGSNQPVSSAPPPTPPKPPSPPLFSPPEPEFAVPTPEPSLKRLYSEPLYHVSEFVPMAMNSSAQFTPGARPWTANSHLPCFKSNPHVETDSLETLILDVLDDTSSTDAKTIADLTGFPKRDCNQVLYALHKKGIIMRTKEPGQPPRWNKSRFSTC